MPLTDTEIRGSKAGEKPYKLADKDGLYVFVTPSGSKIFRYGYRVKTTGKQKTLVIGPYPELSLMKARAKHFEARQMVLEGKDPAQAKQEAKEEKNRSAEADAKAATFAAMAESWFSEWAKGNRADRHIQTTRARLDNHILPRLGESKARELTAPEVTKAIKEIGGSGNELAARCLRIVGQIFRHGVVNGQVPVNPIASIKPNDLHLTRNPANYARLPLSELPAFFRKLEITSAEPRTKLAMKLIALTALRTSELVGLRWEEIDTGKKIITVPAERMKARKAYILPLSAQALDTLSLLRELGDTLPHPSPLVFPGTLGARTMSNMTLLAMISGAGYKGRMTGHGWRGIFSTWAYEAMHDGNLIEACLAHGDKNAVRAAYNDAKYVEPRRAILQAWADELERLGLK